MKIIRPHPDVVHVRAPNQEILARAFIRLQEFYESPYPAIRGNYFTLAEFEDLYTEDHGTPFSYYKDWKGFNVPGRIVRRFARAFAGGLTADEALLISCAPMDYLIGTYRNEDFTHEYAHAMFHLSNAYCTRARRLVAKFESKQWSLSVIFRSWLAREGYTPEVFADEINAYFATNTLSDFEDDFHETDAKLLHRAAAPFRELYADLPRIIGRGRKPVDTKRKAR